MPSDYIMIKQQSKSINYGDEYDSLLEELDNLTSR